MTTLIQLVVGPGEEDNEKFGRLLENFRLDNGLTRAQAAKKIKLSSEYIRLIEHGKRVPANGQARNILETYGVSCIIGRNKLSFNNIIVKFTSRIQAARENTTQEIVTIENLTRAEQIGLIVDQLVRADEKKLRQVHNLLRKN